MIIHKIRKYINASTGIESNYSQCIMPISVATTSTIASSIVSVALGAHAIIVLSDHHGLIQWPTDLSLGSPGSMFIPCIFQ